MSTAPANAGMDLKRFWDLIAASCRHDTGEEEWSDNLVANLARLFPVDILGFDVRLDTLTDAAYTVDLWGAAYLINGGASDDGFYYFRCWLVGMGKNVYEAALVNPDSLARVVSLDSFCEAEIYSVAALAYEQATGRSAADFWTERERLGTRPQPELRGQEWDFDDEAEVRRRFPQLAQLYLTP